MVDWTSRALSPEDAVQVVKSGMRLFVHGASATPSLLLEALAKRTDLTDITLYHLHTNGPAPFADPAHAGRFFSVSLFTGPAVRSAIADGRADYVPVFLSDIPSLFSTGRIPIDVAFLQLSPPDGHGYCTLGTSVDASLAASRAAKHIVAEINVQMPRTHGNTLVPFSSVTACVATNRPLYEVPRPVIGDVEDAIGEQVARLVPDRATLQMGIGAIPDAALRRMGDKHDLGVHTEMFSDGIVDLVEAGVVTNKFKRVHPGRIATSFVMGTQRVYDFVHDNPFVEFFPCDHTNDTAVIRKNEHMVAINSAIEIDLSGQVVADSIGFRIFSGIGGQMDFIRGAASLAGRQADHRVAVDGRRWPGVAHRGGDQTRRRRCHDPRPCALGGHRVRSRRSVWHVAASARRSVDLDCASGFSRGTAT
jgi:acyl-CoA hydrolase